MGIDAAGSGEEVLITIARREDTGFFGCFLWRAEEASV
jgi:hypothetical protein